MAKAYPSTSNSAISVQWVNQQKPIDDRFVVLYVSDLFSESTWQHNSTGSAYVYPGMRVAVVNDSDATNNGIYWLPQKNQYTKQSWDETANNYNENGWRKLYDNTTPISGGGEKTYLDVLDNNEDERPGMFGGTGTQADPHYIKMINCGLITLE